MLQNTRPYRQIYFNGSTYAIKPLGNDFLYICDAPNGTIIETKTFGGKKSNINYVIETYLAENGYTPYEP